MEALFQVSKHEKNDCIPSSNYVRKLLIQGPLFPIQCQTTNSPLLLVLFINVEYHGSDYNLSILHNFQFQIGQFPHFAIALDMKSKLL